MLKEILEKVKKANIEEIKEAFLFSAFFILNGNFEIETKQLDFYLPKEKETITITVNEKITKRREPFEDEEVKEINQDINIDVEELKKIVLKEIKKFKLQAYELNKVIAILQNVKFKNGIKQTKQIWNVICLFSSFQMLRLYIDCLDGKVLKEEKHSIFDFVKMEKGKAAGGT